MIWVDKIACETLNFIIVAIFKHFCQVPASSDKCWTCSVHAHCSINNVEKIYII